MLFRSRGSKDPSTNPGVAFGAPKGRSLETRIATRLSSLEGIGTRDAGGDLSRQPKMGTSSSKSKKASKSKAAAKRAQDQVTEVDRQVLGLKTQKRKLNAYAKRVEEAIARETVKAREFAKSPATKAKALNALRLRKVQEQLSSRVDGWILQVDELLMSIEQARTTATVLEKLNMGNEALKQADRKSVV